MRRYETQRARYLNGYKVKFTKNGARNRGGEPGAKVIHECKRVGWEITYQVQMAVGKVWPAFQQDLGVLKGEERKLSCKYNWTPTPLSSRLGYSHSYIPALRNANGGGAGMTSTREAADEVVFAGGSQISIRARYEETLQKRAKDTGHLLMTDPKCQGT